MRVFVRRCRYPRVRGVQPRKNLGSSESRDSSDRAPEIIAQIECVVCFEHPQFAMFAIKSELAKIAKWQTPLGRVGVREGG